MRPVTGAVRGRSLVRPCRWLLIAVLAAATSGNAQLAGGEFELREATFTAGGGYASQSEFELQGSIGQAHSDGSSGGRFEVFGGLWTPEETDLLFRDSWEG